MLPPHRPHLKCYDNRLFISMVALLRALSTAVFPGDRNSGRPIFPCLLRYSYAGPPVSLAEKRY